MRSCYSSLAAHALLAISEELLLVKRDCVKIRKSRIVKCLDVYCNGLVCANNGKELGCNYVDAVIILSDSAPA